MQRTIAAVTAMAGTLAIAPAAGAVSPMRGATYVTGSGPTEQITFTVSRDGKRVYDIRGRGIPGRCSGDPGTTPLSFRGDTALDAEKITRSGTFRSRIYNDSLVNVTGRFRAGGKLTGRLSYGDRGNCTASLTYTAVALRRGAGSARRVYPLAGGYGATRSSPTATSADLYAVATSALPGGGVAVADTRTPGDSQSRGSIRAIDADGRISPLLSTGPTDGEIPGDLATLRDGSVVWTQPFRNCIRRRSPSGAVSTVAGTCASSTASFAGDGGPAAAALLSSPVHVTAATDGGFLFTDGGEGGPYAVNTRIRRVAPGGRISTVATTPVADVTGPRDGGLLYANGSLLGRYSAAGALTTLGSGVLRYGGDGGPITGAGMAPSSLAPLPDGGYVFVDDLVGRIRMVSPRGTVTTLAGGGEVATGTRAGEAAIDPVDVDVLADGSVAFTERDGAVKLIPSARNGRLLVGLPARAVTFGTFVRARRALPVTVSRAATLTLRLTRGGRP